NSEVENPEFEIRSAKSEIRNPIFEGNLKYGPVGESEGWGPKPRLLFADLRFGFRISDLPGEDMVSQSNLDELCINTIRTLSMDAVQAANSGHPGTPMALAPAAYCLWQRFLRFDPDDPIWPNRDRFILSIGHASMLLYSLLHLTGVKAVNKAYERLGELSVTLEDIKH